MLQKIRDRLTGWVAGIIFFFIAVAFAFWGIDIGGANLNYAAKVNGEEIPIGDFRRQQQAQLAQYAQFYKDGIPAEVESRLREGLLDGFIREELIRQRASKLGYRVGDDAIASAIRSLPAFQVGDEFSMEVYEARLAGQGLSPAGFEARMRQSMRNEQLQRGLSQSGFVTAAELARYVALEDEQREASWTVLPAAAYQAAAEVSEEEIRAEYEANPDTYQSQETVAIEYITLPRSEQSASKEISEQALREYYDQERAVGRFAGAEERQVRHILIAVDEDNDDASALERAAALRARIDAGEDFAALASEFSDDPGSAEQGGDLGWSEPDAYVPAFREAILSIQPGELVGPVRTEFGYHIIRLEEVRGESAKPFDEVRAELLAELKASDAENYFYERAEELRRRAFEAFNELAPVAEDMGLELGKLSGITRNSGPGIALNADVRDTAFSDPVLLDSENSDLIELPEGDALVLRVTNHTLPVLLPYDVVRQQIADSLARAKAEALASEAGRALVERARSGVNMADAERPAGSQYTERKSLRRAEQGVQRELIEAVFAAPRPSGPAYVNGLRLASGDYAVYAVHAIRPGDVSALTAEERSLRARQLSSQNAGLELAAYVDDLRRSASVTINEEQLN